MKPADVPYVFESLEGRCLLSTTQPTDAEQYLVELINRDRANPSAEATRTGVDLNEGLTPGTITSDPKQPLAINPDLIDSATGHSQWMLDNQTFSHTGAGGTDPQQRMADAGYDFVGTWGWAENLAWQSHNGASADVPTIQTVDSNLYIDSGVVDRGHRINLMDGNMKEIGVGLVNGQFDGYNALMVSEDFAYTDQGGTDPASYSFLTGVAYTDADGSNFYAPGEGLGGIAINAQAADGTVYSTTTWDSGGYSLQLPPGTYTVTAEDARLHGIVTDANVTIADQNVELDFVPLTGAAADYSPPVAQLLAAGNIRRAGVSAYAITVQYTDTLGVNVSDITANNLVITGPNRYRQTATSVSVDQSTNGSPRTATYTFDQPAAFARANDGIYVIHLHGGQIADMNDNVARGVALGEFTVRVPPSVARRKPRGFKVTSRGLQAEFPWLSARYSLAYTSSSVGAELFSALFSKSPVDASLLDN